MEVEAPHKGKRGKGKKEPTHEGAVDTTPTPTQIKKNPVNTSAGRPSTAQSTASVAKPQPTKLLQAPNSNAGGSTGGPAGIEGNKSPRKDKERRKARDREGGSSVSGINLNINPNSIPLPNAAPVTLMNKSAPPPGLGMKRLDPQSQSPITTPSSVQPPTQVVQSNAPNTNTEQPSSAPPPSTTERPRRGRPLLGLNSRQFAAALGHAGVAPGARTPKENKPQS